MNTVPHTPREIPVEWLVSLRWCAVALQLTALFIAVVVLELSLPLTALFTVVAITALTNTALPWLAHRIENTKGFLGCVLLLDTALLTALLLLSGGAHNPFSIFYFVHVVLAAVLLGRGWTWITTFFSILCFGSLFLPEAPYHEHGAHTPFSLHLQGMWLGFTISALLVAYFVTQIVSALREREVRLRELQVVAAHEERLISLTTLAAGAAHELATPLSTIAVVSEELQRELATHPDLAGAREDLRLIAAEIQRCRAILDQMGGKSGQTPDEGLREDSLGSILNDLKSELGERPGVQILPEETAASVNLPIRGLLQCLVALIKNGCDAGGQVTVKTTLPSPELVQFTVTDTGSGISHELLPRLGEPFFTTKSPGSGMGLGVFLVKLFAKRVGGTLHFHSTPGEGTVATVTLPLRITAGGVSPR